MEQRLMVHSSTGTSGLPALVPVSSADLGSMGRVARAIRTALDEHIMLAYPVVVTGRVDGADLLARRFNWLTWRAGRLLVTMPPPARERERIGAVIAELRTHADAARRQGDNLDELKRLDTDLHTAVDQVTKLTSCPVCLRQPWDLANTFKARDPETYRCHCPHCSTVWEIRRCRSCKQRYPVLTVRATGEESGGHGDLLDEKFSQELLAEPCWRSPQAYLCHFCGHCPESSRSACQRCQLSKPMDNA